MADIELVIKVPEECYKQIQKHMFSIAYDAIKTKEEKRQVEEKFNVVLAIKNGTPLPKGHGTLKDADELYNIFKEKCDAYNIDNLSFISDMDMNFDLAPTIIEADEEND